MLPTLHYPAILPRLPQPELLRRQPDTRVMLEQLATLQQNNSVRIDFVFSYSGMCFISAFCPFPPSKLILPYPWLAWSQPPPSMPTPAVDAISPNDKQDARRTARTVTEVVST